MFSYLKESWFSWAVAFSMAAVLALFVGKARNAGYKHGHADAEAKYLKQLEQRDAHDKEQFLAWTTHLANLEKQRREAVKRAEEIPVKIVKEYLPGKEIIKHEIKEIPVYSECRITDSVFDQLTAALGGRPAQPGVPSP